MGQGGKEEQEKKKKEGGVAGRVGGCLGENGER